MVSRLWHTSLNLASPSWLVFAIASTNSTKVVQSSFVQLMNSGSPAPCSNVPATYFSPMNSFAIDISRSPVVDMFSEAIRCRISSILTLSSYSKIVFCGIAANGIRAREMMVNRCFILMLYAEMFVNCREYTQLLF